MFNINLDINKLMKFFFEKEKIKKEKDKIELKEQENYVRVKNHNEDNLKKWRI